MPCGITAGEILQKDKVLM